MCLNEPSSIDSNVVPNSSWPFFLPDIVPDVFYSTYLEMGKKVTDNFVYFVYGTIAGIRKLQLTVDVMIALMVEPPRLVRKFLFLIFWSGGFRKDTTGLTSWKQVFQQYGLTEWECSVLFGAERLWLRNRCVVLVVQHHSITLHVRKQQVVGVYLHALCRTDPWSACLQHMVQVRLLSVPAGPGRCPCLSLESSHFFFV